MYLSVNGKKVYTKRDSCFFRNRKKCSIYKNADQYCYGSGYPGNINPPDFCPLKKGSVTVTLEKNEEGKQEVGQ